MRRLLGLHLLEPSFPLPQAAPRQGSAKKSGSNFD